MPISSDAYKAVPRYAMAVISLAALYLASLYNYLLFHSLVELISIAIAFAAFMFAWNSREHMGNRFFLLLGIAYLFVGGMDLVHTLAYKGMNIFPGYDANLPTQLWIAARYMESISLTAALIIYKRRFSNMAVITAYTTITALALWLIFSNKAPACYIEGFGLTAFKVISEYIISALFACAMAFIYIKRADFSPQAYRLLMGSLLLTICSEIVFTYYAGVYDLMNLMGHYLKLLSFYLIYLVIVESGLKKPQDLLFRDLSQYKDQLLEDRNRIKGYMHTAGVVFVVINRDQNISMINIKGCEMLDCAEETITGQNWFDNFLPQKLKYEAKRTFDSIMAGDTQPVGYEEFPVISTLGREKLMAWHNTIIRDKDGTPQYMLCSGEDITQRRKAREALEQANNINTAILDNILDSICIINTSDFNIEAVNKAFLDEYGLTEEMAIGRKCYEVTHKIKTPCSAPDDICPLVEAVKHGSHSMEEHIHYRENGDRVFVEVWAAPIKDSNGNVVRAVHISRDITARKINEDRIKEQHRFLQVLMDTIPNPVFYKDTRGRYMGCNIAFEQFLNLNKDSIVGKTVYELAPASLATIYEKKDLELLNNPGVQIYESSVISNDNEQHDVIFNKATFNRADGSLGGLVGVIVDITNLKQMERSLRQTVTDKEMLIKEIHHRTKNNLIVIQSLLRLQSREIDDEEAKGKLDESHNRVKAISLLHEKLYNSEDLKSLDFSEYLRTLIMHMTRSYNITGSGIEVRTDMDSIPLDIKTMIPCALIINELLTNAFKYAYPGDSSGEVLVSLKHLQEDRYQIVVKDNGAGLPKDQDLTSIKSLGLEIIRALTDQIHGTLEISSNGGAEFKITFSEKRYPSGSPQEQDK